MRLYVSSLHLLVNIYGYFDLFLDVVVVASVHGGNGYIFCKTQKIEIKKNKKIVIGYM